MEVEERLDRRLVIRNLAIEAYWQIDQSKRDESKGVDFLLPSDWKDITEAEAKQALEEIRRLRFPSEDWKLDSPDKKLAQFFVTAYQPEAGQTKVRISFSPEDYEETQKRIRFRNWQKSLNHH